MTLLLLIFLNGTPGRIRTYDLWLRKPTLYPAELRVRVVTVDKSLRLRLTIRCFRGVKYAKEQAVLYHGFKR